MFLETYIILIFYIVVIVDPYSVESQNDFIFQFFPGFDRGGRFVPLDPGSYDYAGDIQMYP